MKTLDEVIKAFECCDHGEPDSRCEDCPYNGIDFCCLELKNDAFHYLKEYHNFDSVDAVTFPEDDNPALSWEELRQMEGKPVWVEADGYVGYWSIVNMLTPEVFCRYYAWLKSSDDPMKAPFDELNSENYGKTWQAYRNERT